MNIIKKILGFIGRIAVYLVLIAITAVITFVVRFKVTWNEMNRGLAVDWTENVGIIEKDIAYSNKHWQKYDLYLPADKNTNALILFIHGGGFTGGDKADEEAWCKYFTSKGYVTASINYSILNGKCENPHLNNMYAELLKGVAHIKKECHKRGYMIDRMATSGQSAGGCLAMLYAFRSKDDSPLPVKFVFQQTGPADFSPEGWGQTEPQGKADFVNMMTGKTITADMVRAGKHNEAVAEISPAALVDSTSCPCLMAYGPKDKVVPPPLKYKLLDQLKKHNVKYDFIEYPNSGHGLLNDPDKQDQFIAMAEEYCKRYF